MRWRFWIFEVRCSGVFWSLRFFFMCFCCGLRTTSEHVFLVSSSDPPFVLSPSSVSRSFRFFLSVHTVKSFRFSCIGYTRREFHNIFYHSFSTTYLSPAFSFLVALGFQRFNLCSYCDLLLFIHPHSLRTRFRLSLPRNHFVYLPPLLCDDTFHDLPLSLLHLSVPQKLNYWYTQILTSLHTLRYFSFTLFQISRFKLQTRAVTSVYLFIFRVPHRSV